MPGAPTGSHCSTRLEIAWTMVPVLILIGIAVPTVTVIFRTAEAAPKSSVQINVIAHQWWWEFQYPQYQFTTANELHIPVGVTANFSLTSADVVHSFWIPSMNGKRDVFANHTNNLWFTPGQTGFFPGQCAEFCGPAHAFMYMGTVVDTKDGFAAWVRDQQAKAVVPASASTQVRRGETLFVQGACASCHTISGVTSGNVGPNLTHLASRRYLSGQLMPMTKQNLAQWITNSSDFKPGSYMPPQPMSKSKLAAIVAFLQTLK